ncbi:nucleoside diphosphate kinase, partial [Fusobacterium animalis ATCC 51191]
EVQSKTDIERNLTNKLKDLQTQYGKDIVKDFEVVKPKGGN